jgi:two-component system, OmpR family, KDP operon response regulator KdpE
MRRPRILVVDDDAEIGRTFEVILNAEGYDVMTTSEGADALVLARQRRIDVVLLDLAMPGMEGMTVLRGLRDISSRVAIIVISAYVDPEREALAKRLGARHVLAKPPAIGELLRLCSELTRSHWETA